MVQIASKCYCNFCAIWAISFCLCCQFSCYSLKQHQSPLLRYPIRCRSNLQKETFLFPHSWLTHCRSSSHSIPQHWAKIVGSSSPFTILCLGSTRVADRPSNWARIPRQRSLLGIGEDTNILAGSLL